MIPRSKSRSSRECNHSNRNHSSNSENALRNQINALSTKLITLDAALKSRIASTDLVLHHASTALKGWPSSPPPSSSSSSSSLSLESQDSAPRPDPEVDAILAKAASIRARLGHVKSPPVKPKQTSPPPPPPPHPSTAESTHTMNPQVPSPAPQWPSSWVVARKEWECALNTHANLLSSGLPPSIRAHTQAVQSALQTTASALVETLEASPTSSTSSYSSNASTNSSSDKVAFTAWYISSLAQHTLTTMNNILPSPSPIPPSRIRNAACKALTDFKSSQPSSLAREEYSISSANSSAQPRPTQFLSPHQLSRAFDAQTWAPQSLDVPWPSSRTRRQPLPRSMDSKTKAAIAHLTAATDATKTMMILSSEVIPILLEAMTPVPNPLTPEWAALLRAVQPLLVNGSHGLLPHIIPGAPEN